MNAKKQLLKTLCKIALGFGIMYLLCAAGGSVSGPDLFFCLLCSGVALGWEWASRIIVATSLYGIVIKFILACILGLPALPIILVRNIFALIRECRGEVE